MGGTKRGLIFLVISCLAALSGCATTPQTRPAGIVLIPESVEVAIGRDVTRQVETEFKVLADPELSKYVDSVGQRLVKVSDRQDIEYHFKILDNKMVNAFACPGGFIYCTTGILKRMDNEAELAGVLGHEIGHVAARHGAKQLQASLGYNILASILLKGTSKDIQKVTNTATSLLFLGYGRTYEFQADWLGTQYAYDAGYDPRGMRDFLVKLKGLEKREPWAIEILLSSHPPTSERIKRVEQQIKGFPSLEEREMYLERYLEAIQELRKKEEEQGEATEEEIE
jgi:predicted Zn-dependent protease